MYTAQSKSHTVAFFPILEALKQLKQEGLANFFEGVSPEQNGLLKLFPFVESLPKLPENMLKSLISKDIDTINKFLKSNGFDIKLNGPIDLGVATIMDLVGTWAGRGNEMSITHENLNYPAIRLEDFVTLQTKAAMRIVHIKTKENFTVHLKLDASEISGFDLFKYILKISELFPDSAEEKCTVDFPMVSLNEQPDVSWIKGLKVSGPEELFISEIVQQNKLSMNTGGIRAQSAVAMGLRKGISLSTYVKVDKPFILWITYGNEPLPLFGAYLAPDSWKNPDK